MEYWAAPMILKSGKPVKTYGDLAQADKEKREEERLATRAEREAAAPTSTAKGSSRQTSGGSTSGSGIQKGKAQSCGPG